MILELKNISVRFSSGHNVQAVEDVNLNVAWQDKVAVVGETGSGKSILLLAILHLLPENAIVTGQALFDGIDLLTLKRRELDKIRGARISYVPQGSGNGMNPLYNVGFQVAEPMIEHQHVPKKEGFAKAVELMRRFHMGNEEKLARQYPHTYSGGMRQRALIAMGIGAGAEMLLADEPTKGLDERRIALVVESFKLLADKTILCVTHDLNFAGTISNYICVMYAAMQVEYARTEDILKNPLHPYTRDMLAAMPENGLNFNKGFAMSHEDYEGAGCKYAKRCSDCFERCMEAPPLFNIGGRQVRCWKYAGDDGNDQMKEVAGRVYTDPRSDKEI